MSKLQTQYVSSGSGSNYHFQTMGSEDDVFFLGAKLTLWKQKWNKYTAFSQSMIVQPLMNQGSGHTMTGPLIKTPDFLYTSYIAQYYPGLIPNSEQGVEECSWVNAAGVFAIQKLSIKIGSSPVLSIEGHSMLVLMELMGDLDKYASLIGFCKTKRQLIENSKRDQYFFTPMTGMPFQNRPDLAYPIGSVAYHGVNCELMSKPLQEMIVNYSGVSSKQGLYALPRNINTNQTIIDSAVQYALATNCVWVSADERTGLVHGYNEILFKEPVIIGTHTIAACATPQRIAFDVTVKGPVVYMACTIQSESDLAEGNHMRLCAETGEDYIEEMMLFTGSIPREDGLKASFYRTAKVIEVFKVSPLRHIYLLAWEVDDTKAQFTGHQNMTNAEKLQFSALYKPHDSPLRVTIIAGVLNGVFTENGTGGRTWGA